MLSTTETYAFILHCVHVAVVTLTVNRDVLLNISKQIDFSVLSRCVYLGFGNKFLHII
jgi:hypothetical protein